MTLRKVKKQLKKSYGTNFKASYFLNYNQSPFIYWKEIDEDFESNESSPQNLPNGRQLLDLYFTGKTMGVIVDNWTINF